METSIHLHARNGDLESVRVLLENGAEVDETDTVEGLTPLMHAARSPRAGVDMLRLLVGHGADVNAVSDPPPPPSMDWLDRLPEEVKKQMPDMSRHDISESRYPVLYYALEGGDRAKIDYLVEAGADLHYRRTGGYDVLIDAVYKLSGKTRMEVVQDFIQRGARIDGVTRYGESALRQASFSADFKVVQLLLRAGADPEPLQWTPLMHATVFGQAKDVRNLLQKRPYEDERDHCQRTAFLLAVLTGSLEKVGVFLEAGVHPGERGLQGKTALMYAAGADHAAIADSLIEHGASVNNIDDYGHTALMAASIEGAKKTVAVLLEAGADLQAKNAYGGKAIKLTNDLAIISLLIRHGADWNDIGDEQRGALAGLPAEYLPQVSSREYVAGRHRRFGSRNPEVMDIPFWREMIKSGIPAYEARRHYEDEKSSMPRSGKAVWCYSRFGKSINVLPDGRMIEIGGEHEDFYDPDFCIYNEVVVFEGGGDFTIYGYPRQVFPPTDFHSATLVDDYIYITGGLGYKGERYYHETPVYRLDIHSFVIQRLHTAGENPGWIHRHQALLLENNQIRISGGKICRPVDGKEKLVENTGAFLLDLKEMRWKRVE